MFPCFSSLQGSSFRGRKTARFCKALVPRFVQCFQPGGPVCWIPCHTIRTATVKHKTPGRDQRNGDVDYFCIHFGVFFFRDLVFFCFLYVSNYIVIVIAYDYLLVISCVVIRDHDMRQLLRSWGFQTPAPTLWHEFNLHRLSKLREMELVIWKKHGFSLVIAWIVFPWKRTWT